MTRIEEIDQEMHDLKIVLRSAEARIPAIYERMEQLTEELDRLNVQAELSPLRTAESFTVEEKCAVFDKLHEQCLSYVRDLIAAKRYPKNGDEYIFESVMTLTLGEGVWDVVNIHIK